MNRMSLTNTDEYEASLLIYLRVTVKKSSGQRLWDMEARQLKAIWGDKITIIAFRAPIQYKDVVLPV